MDSPFTARNQILSLHRKWIEKSGVALTKLGLQNQSIEISPLISYCGEGLDQNIIKIITGLEDSNELLN